MEQTCPNCTHLRTHHSSQGCVWGDGTGKTCTCKTTYMELTPRVNPPKNK